MENNRINIYDKQASEFLIKTNTRVFATKKRIDEKLIGIKEYSYCVYDVLIQRDEDNNISENVERDDIFYRNSRNICTRNEIDSTKRGYRFEFSDSCMNFKDNKLPTAYDILSCLTVYDVGRFRDFCCDFGYDDDSIKAYKIYESVINEYKNLRELYSFDELDMLREIA
jgi:hypothetical protein